jgi:hypothetical protein
MFQLAAARTDVSSGAATRCEGVHTGPAVVWDVAHP